MSSVYSGYENPDDAPYKPLGHVTNPDPETLFWTSGVCAASGGETYVPLLVICKHHFYSSSYLETGIKMVNTNDK